MDTEEGDLASAVSLIAITLCSTFCPPSPLVSVPPSSLNFEVKLDLELLSRRLLPKIDNDAMSWGTQAVARVCPPANRCSPFFHGLRRILEPHQSRCFVLSLCPYLYPSLCPGICLSLKSTHAKADSFEQMPLRLLQPSELQNVATFGRDLMGTDLCVCEAVCANFCRRRRGCDRDSHSFRPVAAVQSGQPFQFD